MYRARVGAWKALIQRALSTRYPRRRSRIIYQCSHRQSVYFFKNALKLKLEGKFIKNSLKLKFELNSMFTFQL
ncbi:hypothetical protein BGS_1327 [Beggiatoa sp. SS]|nr:hypothetical protein BGS_1327 [Beggiatoa sp. SS]